MARIFLEAGAATRPVPRGAGIKRTLTLPQVPESFMGIVCGSPEFLLCRINVSDARRLQLRGDSLEAAGASIFRF